MHSILIIFLKELKDMLRDRRTIMAMVILPLVLIPIIFTVMARMSFAPKDINKGTFRDIKVAVVTNNNGEALMKRFQRRKDLKILEGISPYDFKDLILNDSIDFGLILNENFDQQIKTGNRGDIEIFHKTSSRDTLLYGRFIKTIKDYRKTIVQERLEALGTNTTVLNPTRIDSTNVSPKKNAIGAFAGSTLPIFFVLFCFMGAMYPAIDLFTGEKERGTIETLLILPTNRFQILIGKLLVIVATGVTSGILTFLGIFLFIQLNPDLPLISTILSLDSVGWIILMMIPLTTFFAGVLIPISIYAKTFKEAQSLIQPMIILILIPVIIGMFPSTELNFKTAFIPILNVALASREIVAGSIDFGHLTLVYLSLFLLAALGILLAKRWFGNEGNIFRT